MNVDAISPDENRVVVVRKRRWFRWVAVLTLVYGAMCAALMFMEPRLIFPGAYFENAYTADPGRFTPEQPRTSSN